MGCQVPISLRFFTKGFNASHRVAEPYPVWEELPLFMNIQNAMDLLCRVSRWKLRAFHVGPRILSEEMLAFKY